ALTVARSPNRPPIARIRRKPLLTCAVGYGHLPDDAGGQGLLGWRDALLANATDTKCLLGNPA
ncbi:hypothetical protein ACFWDZ_32650, partial [Micromonospora aurantiaca]|uniref:hypothetical protein n=1 Tax=Micromonospora aurantiaca (nom. illeg.) TaxID=47850 RepID=UPI003657FC38